MSAFSPGGKTNVLFSKIGLFLTACFIFMAVFGACVKNADSDESATLKPSSAGLTSVEAQKLAWTKAKDVFKDSVLFRMAPVETEKSTDMKLSGDWLASDRADAWYAWYADSNSGDWFMVGIKGRSISDTDIGTRSFTAESFDSGLPRETTPVSMKDAAAAAKAQGANMESVTWVEYQCEHFNSSTARLPLWVFTCSDTPAAGTTLNYSIYVNAATGKVEGA